jgi:DNA-binding GntR family transcriptional regulator
MHNVLDRSRATGNRRVTRVTLTEQVEDALRLDILEGVFEPGQRLRASELSSRYNVSATPLREALQRLAAQNLIEIDPRLGATVAPISQEDLHDIYWLRGLLEVLALERSVARGGPEWEESINAALGQLRSVTLTASQEEGSLSSALAWSQAHRALHEALFSACGSPWLLRVLETLHDQSERYRMLSVVGGRDALEEHERIVQEAVGRHSDAAIEALRNHLLKTVKTLAANR